MRKPLTSILLALSIALMIGNVVLAQDAVAEEPVAEDAVADDSSQDDATEDDAEEETVEEDAPAEEEVTEERAGDDEDSTEDAATEEDAPAEDEMTEEDAPEEEEASEEDTPDEEDATEEDAEEGAAAETDTAEAAAEPLPDEYSCMFCHGDTETFFDDTENLLVTEKDLLQDIHWQKGLRCHDCHGGSPDLESFTEHRKDPSFNRLAVRGDVPEFCGRCHSDIEYMRKFRPSPRTDQLADYWTSGHGMLLKADKDNQDVATCVSCHGHHEIRAVDDLKSPVYPTRLAKTCATCHSDVEKMAGREYNGRPLGHDQFQLWQKSIHAEALLEKGDLSAPTCNDCHGNHGALPPEIGSVANACGTCHVKVAQLFAETRMKHRFEEVKLPGCATCHGHHEIRHPTDEMLGMDPEAVCTGCHQEGQYGAPLANEKVGQMREGLEELKELIASATEKLDEAERLGMEIRAPRFHLRGAQDALTNARSLVHSFALEPMKEALDVGIEVGREVDKQADMALRAYTFRRVWLAFSLVPILIVTSLLLRYIRKLPIPENGEG